MVGMEAASLGLRLGHILAGFGLPVTAVTGAVRDLRGGVYPDLPGVRHPAGR